MLCLNKGGDAAVGGEYLRYFSLRGARRVEPAVPPGRAHSEQAGGGESLEVPAVGTGKLVARLGVRAEHVLAESPRDLPYLRVADGRPSRRVGRLRGADCVGGALVWRPLGGRRLRHGRVS